MPWVRRGLVMVFQGRFEEPGNAALQDYRWSSVPILERPHPAACGQPRIGRRVHEVLGEPLCEACRVAEDTEAARRREAAAERQREAAS